MNAHGGLDAIPPYLIARQWWLHQIRGLRAQRRVHGSFNDSLRRVYQKELCKIRKEHYVRSTTDKPVATV